MNCTPKVRQKTFGVQFNLMGSPFSIPDVAYGYSSLVNDLNGNYDIEEVMKRAAIRTMNLWNEYCEVIEVTRIRDLSMFWSAIHEIFYAMQSSINETCFSTDAPAIVGEPYGRSYMRALRDLQNNHTDDIYDYIRADYSVDLADFLHNSHRISFTRFKFKEFFA